MRASGLIPHAPCLTEFRLVVPGSNAEVEFDRGSASRAKLLLGDLPLQLVLVFKRNADAAAEQEPPALDPFAAQSTQIGAIRHTEI